MKELRLIRGPDSLWLAFQLLGETGRQPTISFVLTVQLLEIADLEIELTSLHFGPERAIRFKGIFNRVTPRVGKNNYLPDHFRRSNQVSGMFYLHEGRYVGKIDDTTQA